MAHNTDVNTGTASGRSARIAGVLYLIITVAAILAHMYVPGQLIVPGDPAATSANIVASESLFRVAIGSELVILLSEIVLAVILYGLFRSVNKTLSLTAAVSRLAMTTIHGINLLNYFFILLLLRDPHYLSVFGAEQVDVLVALFLEAHHYGFAIGIAFLIIHVFLLGYLIIQSGYVPRALGVLFLLAGFGYLFDSVGILLLPGYTTTPAWAATAIAAAEIAFPVWLLIKGIRIKSHNVELSQSSAQTEAVGAL